MTHLNFPSSLPFLFFIINNSSVLQLFWPCWHGAGQLLQISRQEKQGSQGSNAALQLLSSSMARQDWVLHLRLPLPDTLIFPWLHSWSSRASSDCCPLSTSLQTMFTCHSCSRCCKLKEIVLNAPNHTNVHLIVRQWGCSTFVCSLLQFMTNDRVPYSSTT